MAKKERPEYEALVNRIASGELTRQQAAEIAHEQTGLSAGTFLVWLSSSGASERLKEQRGTAGDNSIHSHAKNDPDKAEAYKRAIDAVMHGMPGAQAARRFDVNYQYLMRKVLNVRSRLQGTEGAQREMQLADALEREGKSHFVHMAAGSGKSGHALEFFKEVLKRREGRPVIVVTKDGATDPELLRAMETWKEAKEQAQKALVVFASAEAALAAQEALSELRDGEPEVVSEQPQCK